MSAQNAYETYQSQAVTTASPGQLTLMLYNGCLKFIRRAQTALVNEDLEEKNTNLLKAQNILQELMVTLDTNVDVADHMMQMYDYIHRRLIEANVNNDGDILEEVAGYVTEFRDTWKEVLRINRKEQYGGSGQA